MYTLRKNLEVRFTGKIERIFNSTSFDDESYIIVDGKKITVKTNNAWDRPQGKLIGIDLSANKEGKKYIGKTVEVFAVKDTDYKTLSLRGKSYYIKLIK